MKTSVWIKHLLIVVSLGSVTLGSVAMAQGAPQESASGKPFKRALVISGGGITPGVGLGILKGLERSGWKPDVVITTCGASVASALRNSFPTTKESIKFALSPTFHKALRMAKVETRSALDVQRKFDSYKTDDSLPQYFERNVLTFPQDFQGLLPHNQFQATEGTPRFVMVAARTHFGPKDVGAPLLPSFTQVYFTDADTAEKLKNFPSPIRAKFPESRLDPLTETITNATTESALRGSIADPFLLAPGEFNGDYYMTGAVDLYPIETAMELADEVVSTYPASLFADFEDFAIKRTFGFSQNKSALHAIQNTQVKWIDISGIEEVNFDPKLKVLWLVDRVPQKLEDFRKGIQEQIDFGSSRAMEAMAVQKTKTDARSHLRKPISKKLLENFTCENAYVWQTPENAYCTKDWYNGCNRKTATQCRPIR